MNQGRNPVARLLRYLWSNALWWAVPLLLIVAALLLFVWLTAEPTSTVPNIYQVPEGRQRVRN